MTLSSVEQKVEVAIQTAKEAFNCSEFEACALVYEIIHKRANTCNLKVVDKHGTR